MHDFDTDGHRARKRFGQNFLSDPNIIRKIIDGIRPQPGELMVEIGPGLGAMTDPLIERLGHLHVVEIDRDLIARLHERYTAEQLTVHEGDALKFDFASLCAGVEGGGERSLRIVGNLPYNISTPILFHVMEHAEAVKDMHFMLQKEVVDRMAAEPGSKTYGRLSVMLQAVCRVTPLFDVPPGAFTPPPKVDSAVVRLVPRPPGEAGVKDAAHFARTVAAAFSQRRKTLRNSLSTVCDAEAIRAAGIDPGARAEAVAVDAYITLSNQLIAAGIQLPEAGAL